MLFAAFFIWKRYREASLMPVLAPAGEILSFARPKESIPRKGRPDAA